MIDEIYQRSITVGASVILVTLAVPLVRVVGGRPGGLVRFACLTIDGALISLMALSLYWFASVYDELESGLYDFLRDDIVVGAGGLLAVLELTRRAFGWPLAVLSLLCIAYALFGEDLPWITCPDLPVLPQPATVEDLVQAWIAIGPVHVACREALAVWRKAWTACDQPERR